MEIAAGQKRLQKSKNHLLNVAPGYHARLDTWSMPYLVNLAKAITHNTNNQSS